MTNKNVDLFFEGDLRPDELEQTGLSGDRTMKVCAFIEELAVSGKIRTFRFRITECGGKIISIWLKAGGTVEFELSDTGEITMIDTFGCDVGFSLGSLEFRSHDSSNDERERWGDPDHEGPVNSDELFREIFGELASIVPGSSDPDTHH